VKRWSVVAVLVALVLAAMAAGASHILPAEGILRTNVQLRREPSEESESLMILKQGQSVTVVEIVGGWARVRYGSFSGYIRGDLFVDTTQGESPYADERFPADKPIGLGFSETLKLGRRGEYVRQLQIVLIALGYLEPDADGIFGPDTRAAVIAFQKAQKLKADGIVGAATYEALAYVLAEAAQK